MIVFLIPVAALVLAMTWVRWARRPNKPMDPMSQVEAYRRTVLALERYDERVGLRAERKSAD